MAAVRSNIALTEAGVPEETAEKLAAADSKFDVEETLIAALEAIGKVRKWQQTMDGECAKCWRRARRRSMTIVTIRKPES